MKFFKYQKISNQNAKSYGSLKTKNRKNLAHFSGSVRFNQETNEVFN